MFCPICLAVFVARRQFVHYQVEREIGRGGMGAVYKAFDMDLGRRVALKVLRRELQLGTDFIERLSFEAKVTASINHPNVVRVFGSGSFHGMFYIVLELLEGGSLAELISSQGRVAELQGLNLGIQVASGLRAAEKVGLIHRDIKPGNILLSDSQIAKIVDFGLAASPENLDPESNEIWGSPHYLAPERLRGVEDLRSDIYSLGASLYHAMSGRTPFESSDPKAIALKHLQSQVVSVQAFAPHLSNSTAFCIKRMLEKNPDDRFQSYDDLITNLEYARVTVLDSLDKPGAKQRVVVEPEHADKFLALAIIGIVSLALLLGGFVLGKMREEKGAVPAPRGVAFQLDPAKPPTPRANLLVIPPAAEARERDVPPGKPFTRQFAELTTGDVARSPNALPPEAVPDSEGTFTVPGRIEAEAFTKMSGVRLQPVEDPDEGGVDLAGWIDTDDWIDYDISPSASSTYLVEFRVSSPVDTGILEIRRRTGGTVLARKNIPKTSGYQTLGTVVSQVFLEAGRQTLRIHIVRGEFNLNWINFHLGPYLIPGRIEAEGCMEMEGVKLEINRDPLGGGLNAGWFNAGDWMDYFVRPAENGSYRVQCRVSSPTGGHLELRDGDRTVVGTIEIPDTGAFENWTTVEGKVSLTAREQVIRMRVARGEFNLNWIDFRSK